MTLTCYEFSLHISDSSATTKENKMKDYNNNNKPT